MADARLLSRLDDVARRLRLIRRSWFLAAGWALLALLLAVVCLAPQWLSMGRWVFVAAVPVLLILGYWFGAPRARDRKQIALLLERDHPELDARLLTAMQQDPQRDAFSFSYLQMELLSEVLGEIRKNRWDQTVLRSRLIAARTVQLATFAACVAVAVLAFWQPSQKSTIAKQGPSGDSSSRSDEFEISVEPGDAEIERGTSLVVIARFPGAVPQQVELVAVDESSKEQRIPFNKSLEDPLFGGRMAEVQRDFTYHIEFDGRRSDDFSVTTFEYPTLLRADADITPPEYTGQSPKTLEDVRRFSVAEGSELQLTNYLNKQVEQAVLIDEDGERHPLAMHADDPLQAGFAWTATQPGERTFKLELFDANGRKNKEPAEFRISVLENHPPDLKVAFPGRDVRVSALQELSLTAEALDDFGLTNVGLIYETPDGEAKSIEFGNTAGADEKTVAEHLLALEGLDLVPDDLVSYYFFAEDTGPDGQPRRSFSDIFFAEIRPFEEIYRQVPPQAGQQQQQQQGQQNQQGQADQLLELQKQVITAAWNLLRREPKPPLTSQWSEDVQTLIESQAQAISMTEEVSGQLEDPEMLQHAEDARAHMNQARDVFQQAIIDSNRDSLSDGRKAAQAAYRALLRMQSREKNIQNAQSQQQQQQQSASASRQRMDQQMRELQLKNDRDRYETERQAQQQQAEQNEEDRQVQDRLKQLARRQEDLNQRIQELEMALRNAETPEEREELERRLKRLQEEQREMLRNLDELQQQMDQEQNRQRMAEAREQIEQTRERVRQASEALQQGMTSQALSEGTRAERELEQLEEDFRKKNAGQFDEALRDLREEVRELNDRERELSETMRSPQSDEEGDRPSLRSEQTDPREKIVEQMNEQSQRLSEVLEQTKELVENSESSEPLLSRKLYDTLRDLREYEPEEALSNASRMTRYGLSNEAQQLEEQARKGMERLQSGVEDAANSILGDDTEALQLAQSQLDRLTDSIRQELDRNAQSESDEETGERSGNRPGNNRSEAAADESEQESEAQAGSSESGTRQGENKEEEEPNGERQQGSAESSDESADQQRREAEDNADEQSRDPQQRSPGNPSGRNPQRSNSPNQQESETQQRSPGEGAQRGSGQQPMEQNSQQPNSDGEQPQNNQPQGGRQQGGRQQGGQQEGRDAQPESQASDLAQSLSNLFNQQEGNQESRGGGQRSGPSNPLTGETFPQWSNGMRDLEDMLTTPELRERAAQIRERARQARLEVKRHSATPNWDLVRTDIYGPMLELQDLIAEELARRNPRRDLVPIDRDPVPEKYEELVRAYYEQLSREAVSEEEE